MDSLFGLRDSIIGQPVYKIKRTKDDLLWLRLGESGQHSFTSACFYRLFMNGKLYLSKEDRFDAHAFRAIEYDWSRYSFDKTYNNGQLYALNGFTLTGVAQNGYDMKISFASDDEDAVLELYMDRSDMSAPWRRCYNRKPLSIEKHEDVKRYIGQMQIKIRPEEERDFESIYEFVKTAFLTAKVKDGSEQDYVDKNRSRGYIPELALLAEYDSGIRSAIVGYIMLVETELLHNGIAKTVLLLGPLAVDEGSRGKGIGSKLMRYALSKAARMGYDLVFIAGDPAYYGRFGFKAMMDYGISCTMTVPEELLPCLMLCELKEGAAKGYNGARAVFYT